MLGESFKIQYLAICQLDVERNLIDFEIENVRLLFKGLKCNIRGQLRTLILNTALVLQLLQVFIIRGEGLVSGGKNYIYNTIIYIYNYIYNYIYTHMCITICSCSLYVYVRMHRFVVLLRFISEPALSPFPPAQEPPWPIHLSTTKFASHRWPHQTITSTDA